MVGPRFDAEGRFVIGPGVEGREVVVGVEGAPSGPLTFLEICGEANRGADGGSDFEGLPKVGYTDELAIEGD